MTAAGLAIHPDALATWRAKRRDIAGAALAPPSRLTLSQWADRFRKLSADLGEPGPWRTSRVPYMREIMDAITDPLVREVVVMKSARVGATQALVCNTVGFYIHQEPSPIIVAFPTENDAKKFSKTMLTPMIGDTPVLAKRVADGGRSHDASNTILSKTFPGGAVQIVGTSSPRNMRAIHGRVVLMSEVDGYVASAGEDGDPGVLLKKRADAYGSPKFVLESTPLMKGSSRIESAFLASDQRHYYVPCPHCGVFQRLVWGGRDVPNGVKWTRDADTGRVTAVYYVCEAGCVIEESAKFRMVAAGEWIPANPGASVRGYHLNALISPFPGARWPRLVEQWLDAQGKPERLKGFFNTVLGLTFEEEGSEVDAHVLADRVSEYPLAPGWESRRPEERRDGQPLQEDYLVPGGVGVLTFFCDVQDDRLEYVVWGFGEGEERWLVDHVVIPGDPATPAPWKSLDAARARVYQHEHGAAMRVAAGFVDSGGHHTKEVYAYTRARNREKVYASKGSSLGEGAPLLSRPRKSDSAKAILYMIGAFTAKESFLARLGRVKAPGPGRVHFPAWIDGEQLSQHIAEKLITRFIGGRPKRLFIKTGRNEMLDCAAGCSAALHLLGPGVTRNLGAMAVRLATQGRAATEQADAPETAPAPSRPPQRRGSWAQRWRG